MTDTLRNKCELFERSRVAISRNFLFEKSLMSTAAALIFTGADREADIDRMKECRSILNKHTGVFSGYRDNVKLALLGEMALSDDAEQYIEDVKAVYQKLHKGHFRDNSYMVLAAMLLCGLGRLNTADEVIAKHNEIMQRMEKLHPFITNKEDISYVILLALSDRTVDDIVDDMETCLEYLKKTCKIGAGSDSIQGLSEMLALTDGDIKEKCDRVIRLYDLLKENKKDIIWGGTVFSSLGMLTGTDEEPEVIVNDILEADEYLKGCRLFGKDAEDKNQRLMFAELLTASSRRTDAAIVNNAFINSAFGIIKAQQIVAVITVISNVLPAVLSAVSDGDSKETDSGDSQAEQQNTENDKVNK